MISLEHCGNNGESVLSAMFTIPSRILAGIILGALVPVTHFPSEQPVTQALFIDGEMEAQRG